MSFPIKRSARSYKFSGEVQKLSVTMKQWPKQDISLDLTVTESLHQNGKTQHVKNGNTFSGLV